MRFHSPRMQLNQLGAAEDMPTGPVAISGSQPLLCGAALEQNRPVLLLRRGQGAWHIRSTVGGEVRWDRSMFAAWSAHNCMRQQAHLVGVTRSESH